MAKNPTYRKLIEELYSHYISMSEYYQRFYGFSARDIQEPHYRESRRRNYEAFYRKINAEIDRLREMADRREAEAEREAEQYAQDREDDYADWDTDDYSYAEDRDAEEQESLFTSTYNMLTGGASSEELGEVVYTNYEQALYDNYMSRLYYYQFNPSIKALIDTIEGDDLFKDAIIRALKAKVAGGGSGGAGGGLPDIEFGGSYEVAEQIAMSVQEFLNSTSGEQLFDEGYADWDYY